MGAKTQNFIATTILASAVMVGGRAEAADVTIHMERINDLVQCWAVNHGPYNVCVVVDVYSVIAGHPRHHAISRNISGYKYWAVSQMYIAQKPPLKCTIISAKYQQPYLPCTP